MSNLDFLKNLSLLGETKEMLTRASEARTKVDVTPTDADIRIFKDGRVFPSKELVEEFDLEYRPKNTDPSQRGNGFDIIDSREFHQYPKDNPAIMFITAVPKKEPKVDLFGTSMYDDEGNPIKSVLTQGASTRGKEIIETLSSLYGLDKDKMFEETGYIDLIILRDYKLTTPNNIYYIMKKVARGERKGELEPIRREHLTLMPLVVKGSSYDPNATKDTVEDSNIPEEVENQGMVMEEPVTTVSDESSIDNVQDIVQGPGNMEQVEDEEFQSPTSMLANLLS